MKNVLLTWVVAAALLPACSNMDGIVDYITTYDYSCW
jgi:hypothetical protein